MKNLLLYTRAFIGHLSPVAILLTIYLVTAAIWYNYEYGIEESARQLSSWTRQLGLRFLILSLGFGLPWFFLPKRLWKRYTQPRFLVLLFFFPLLFAFKISFPSQFPAGDLMHDYNWNRIISWSGWFILCNILFIWAGGKWNAGSIIYKSLRIILTLLPIVVVIILAGIQDKGVTDNYPLYEKTVYTSPLSFLLFELAYGLDILSMEIFFRGILILVFFRYGGPHVLLPIASFYCFIHFGKPWMEAASSFAGGIFMGILFLYTRSLLPGSVLHLTLAWGMEGAASINRNPVKF